MPSRPLSLRDSDHPTVQRLEEAISTIHVVCSSSVFDYGSPTTDYDPLKLLIFWMSNTVQLYVHVLHELHTHSVNPDPEDEVKAGLQELATGLEDVVSFSFQQTVYCVTKVQTPRKYVKWAEAPHNT